MADRHGRMQLRVVRMERIMARGNKYGVVVRIFRPDPSYIECVIAPLSLSVHIYLFLCLALLPLMTMPVRLPYRPTPPHATPSITIPTG